jgi:iron-sulfur cluster assembly protein
MISVTQTAKDKIIYNLQKRGKGLGIRIGVKTTGCSGLAYVLEYVDSPTELDESIDCNGCMIYIDKKSCPYLEGMTIDFVKKGLNEGFEFINPQEKDRCGCGESFRV